MSRFIPAARLFFPLADVVAAAEHAVASPAHRLAYGDTSPYPALWWVKDDGTYLMSNGIPAEGAKPDDDPAGRSTPRGGGPARTPARCSAETTSATPTRCVRPVGQTTETRFSACCAARCGTGTPALSWSSAPMVHRPGWPLRGRVGSARGAPGSEGALPVGATRGGAGRVCVRPRLFRVCGGPAVVRRSGPLARLAQPPDLPKPQPNRGDRPKDDSAQSRDAFSSIAARVLRPGQLRSLTHKCV